MAQLTILTPPVIAKTPPFPCLQCLSMSELQLALLYLFAELEGYTLETPGVLATLDSDAACYSCWSDRQKLMGVITALANETNKFQTEGALAAALKCLRCLAPGKVKAMLAYLMVKTFSTPI